jgi:hypothetical protein
MIIECTSGAVAVYEAEGSPSISLPVRLWRENISGWIVGVVQHPGNHGLVDANLILQEGNDNLTFVGYRFQ